MAPLAVDPEALDCAGSAVISIGEGLSATITSLTNSLADCTDMSGDDPVGAAFGHSYDRSASKLLEAMATTRNGLCRLGDGVRISAHNYSVAEANSDISGHRHTLPAAHPTGAYTAHSTPPSVGCGVGAPAGWGWVSKYIGMIWPNGDSGKLRVAAAAWISAGTSFEVGEITGAVGPMGTVAAQQIPEGPAIAAAFAETHRCSTAVLQQCASIATQLTSYASKIDKVHAAIVDLLSRICNPWTGIKEVWDILTHEDEDEIKKIANDIRIIVGQFTAEVDALRQQVAKAITEATTILSTMAHYAEKEWDHFLHTTEVGRTLDHLGHICSGVIAEAESTVKGMWTLNPLRAVVDPKGFLHSLSGALENLEELSGLEGGRKAEEAWKDLGKGIVHWDEWATDPLKAAGESLFDVGTLLLPGGPLSKLPTVGKLAAEAVEVPKGLHLPNPARLPNPAPHDNPSPKNEPPRGGQPTAPAKPGTALPPYGFTDPRAPATGKPATAPVPKTADEISPAPPGHEPGHNRALAPAPADNPVESPGSLASSLAPPVAMPATPNPSASMETYGGSANDAPSHGLAEEKRDEILAIPKGDRPDPSDYLSQEYIEHHLQQFRDGATRFMPETNLDKYGIAQRDGTSFVMPKSEADALVEAVRNDPRAMERALGLVKGFLDSNKIVRIDIGHPDQYDLRLPSGNEAGANDQWVPGGKLPDGASEAVIDGGNVLPQSYSVTDVIDEEGSDEVRR